jgi:hypothetical protein
MARCVWQAARWWIGGLAMIGTFAMGPNAIAQSTTIYACVNSSDGTLRIVAQGVVCKKNEISTSWNVTGPAGARGPSNAFYTNSSAGGFSAITLGTDFTLLYTLSLPAGSFVVYSTANLAAVNSEAVVECEMIQGNNLGSVVGRGTFSGAVNGFLALPLVGVITLSTASSVSVLCRTDGAVDDQPSDLTAIQVDTLTRQLDHH